MAGTGMTSDEYDKYIDEYDDRKELEVGADYARNVGDPGPDGEFGTDDDVSGPGRLDLQSQGFDIQEQQLDSKRDELALASQGIGRQASGELFGQLTQSQARQSKSGLAGAGSFADKFSQGQMMSGIKGQYDKQDIQRDNIGLESEALGLDRAGLDIERDQALADKDADIADLHDNYNQQFWEQMATWDSAKSA